MPGATPTANGETSMEDVPSDQRTPYHYTYVADHTVAAWTETGSQSILDSAASLDDLQLGDLLQELIRSALDGRLMGQQAGSSLATDLLNRQHNEAACSLER